MYYISDDPIKDYDRYCAQLEKEEEKLPVCDYCEKIIDDDYYYNINGDILCEDCLNESFRKDVEDY